MFAFYRYLPVKVKITSKINYRKIPVNRKQAKIPTGKIFLKMAQPVEKKNGRQIFTAGKTRTLFVTSPEWEIRDQIHISK